MIYQRNCWYVAAVPSELRPGPVARTIVETPILMWRRADGGVTAMSNLCPHRFAPLDRGVLKDDVIACKYHGLAFGADGRCVHNPHASRTDPRTHLRTFPVVERYGMIWVWPGDPEAADIGLVPDMTKFEPQPGQRVLINYFHTDYRYDILIDNLMDLSHADYLHHGSFTNGPPERTEIDVTEEGDDVILRRTCYRAPLSPMAILQGGATGSDGLVDFRDVIHWHPGQVITFQNQATGAGGSFDGIPSFDFFHIGTPADESHTHYFTGGLLVGPEDIEADERMRLGQRAVIELEDGPMLQAVHDVMAGRELLEMQPVILPVDAGGLRVRRMMDRLVERERASVEKAPAMA